MNNLFTTDKNMHRLILYGLTRVFSGKFGLNPNSKRERKDNHNYQPVISPGLSNFIAGRQVGVMPYVKDLYLFESPGPGDSSVIFPGFCCLKLLQVVFVSGLPCDTFGIVMPGDDMACLYPTCWESLLFFSLYN
jgi:hypothetical protein